MSTSNNDKNDNNISNEENNSNIYSSENDNEDENSEALNNIKKSLNLTIQTNVNNNNNNNIYYQKNNYINETEENMNPSNKINFNDVFKAYTKNISETTKTNLSNALKQNIKNKKKNIVEIKFNDNSEKIIEREKNYSNLSKDITKYQNKVKSIREADIIDFTQDNNKTIRRIDKTTAKEISNNNKNINNNNFENKIKNILIKNNCETDDKILIKENEELSKINPDEMKRRYNELKRVRKLLLQREIRNAKKNKIKSKLYHKINKNRKEKEEKNLLEQLGEIDPEAVENYLNKKKRDRADERMMLKHSINSKFQKTIKKYHFNRDSQVKEAIKENYQLRDKLMEKIKGNESDDSDVNNNEEEDEEIEEDNNNDNINDNDHNDKLLINFEERYKKNNNEEEENEDNGIFSMPFMKNAEKNKEEFLKKLNNLNNAENEDDYNEIDEEDNKDDNEKSDESSDSENSDKNKSNKNKNNLKKINNNNDSINDNKKNITSEDINKINNEAKEILNNNNESKNESIKVDITPNELQQMINEENINEDTEQFKNFLIENDINKKEFLESENIEQINKIKKENPEFMSGWGSWAGDSIQIKAKEFLQKKRYENKIAKLNELANKNNNKNPFVKINNSYDKNYINNYLIKELPKDVPNREQFEKLNSTAVGREWNSLTMYKKIILPRIVKKIGQIIQPMSITDKTKAIKLVEVLKNVTKKKKSTKSKL